MEKRVDIKLNSNHIYDIVIKNEFDGIVDEFKNIGITGKKLCIVTDTNVGPLYLEKLSSVLEKTGNEVYSFAFPSGEENKTLENIENLYEYLIINHFERKDMLVALGGGVVGDMTGYAAATYLRGIDFIQVPTTLLAQVDSSIGGKTGVDFRKYKNMVGAFHMPRLVYINISTLSTLSERLFNSGMGEIIKHGLIKDSAYYEFLKENTQSIKALDSETLASMIYRSCQIKGNVVENDPTEKGERALLNFGHTLGHAVEKLMNFSLYHGECVGLGMIAASYISYKRGHISLDDYNGIVDMLKKYNFPLTANGIEIKDVLETSKSDKKMENGVVKFILLESVGHAIIDKTVTFDEMTGGLSKIILE